MIKDSKGQQELFPRLVKSIEYSQDNIISDILRLHVKNRVIDLDPTYSIGGIYSGRICQPKLKFDITPPPLLDGVKRADCRKLPLVDSSIGCIMFDPPFIISGEITPGNKMQKRFSGFRRFEDLVSMYDESLREFYRIMKKGGILIFKCQDVCNANKQYFTHVKVMELAVKNNLYPLDLFIYMNKNRMIGEHIKQQHARKFHSYFWVFKKKRVSVDYGFSSGPEIFSNAKK